MFGSLQNLSFIDTPAFHFYNIIIVVKKFSKTRIKTSFAVVMDREIDESISNRQCSDIDKVNLINQLMLRKPV